LPARDPSAEQADEKIAFLADFKRDINSFFNGNQEPELRTRISRSMRRARDIVTETGSLKLVTLAPPRAVGGIGVQNADPFGFITQDYYGMSLIPAVADMVEEAIGVLQSPEYRENLRRRPERQKNNKGGTAPLAYPDKVTLRWLFDHAPLRLWLIAAATIISVALFFFGIGFRLSQHAGAADVLKSIPGLEQLPVEPQPAVDRKK
jgi:hypothetical protein